MCALGLKSLYFCFFWKGKIVIRLFFLKYENIPWVYQFLCKIFVNHRYLTIIQPKLPYLSIDIWSIKDWEMKSDTTANSNNIHATSLFFVNRMIDTINSEVSPGHCTKLDKKKSQYQSGQTSRPYHLTHGGSRKPNIKISHGHFSRLDFL